MNNSSSSSNKNEKQNLKSNHFFPPYIGHCENCNFFFQSTISSVRKIIIIHVNSEMES